MPTLPVCNACRDGQDFPTAITMAFQPIVDVSTRSIYAGEALVRGVNGESAGSILAAVDER
ncbi:diguanylate phosphodiesterase, partial [Xanthomonas arboricola]